MDANKIPDSNLPDIIFDSWNKEYGTNDPRKNYNTRMAFALILTVALLLLILFGNVFTNPLKSKEDKTGMIVQDVLPDEVKREAPKNETPPPPPPPPPKPEPPKVEMAKFTPPKIEKYEEVKEDERPPEVEKPEDNRNGTINQEGIKDGSMVAPPAPASDEGKGVVEAPRKVQEDWDKTFTKVEIESEYPGGTSAWQRYLNKHLRYPQETINNEIQGTVVVQFIVDKEGVISGVEATCGPNELCEKAIRVIRKSNKWTPAVQNGRQVKSCKKQPITFRLEPERGS
jgi:protein TonB